MPADYQYLKDVTIPDEMKIAIGTPFVKTWRVRNTGTVAWTPDFTLRFQQGTPMTTAREQPLPPCEPGEEVELSLELTAPMTTGRHYGDWYLYDPDGNVFGEVIYLVIQARTPKEIANGRPDADFVADVTIPDDTVIPLGQPFKKIWRVRNTGNVTWGEGYSLVHTDGESMTDDTTVTVPTTRVGDTAEITIRFTAPAKAGRYYSDWRFHDGTDRIFGDIIHTRINAKPDENNIGINDSTVLKDVTIPDDTKLQPGETFTKTWLARNSGTKAWGEGYTLRFIEGNAMTTQTDVPLPAAKPGDEVMISVELTAPQTLGTHYCDWKMIDDQNRPFGDIFWARIVVPTRNGQEKPDELRPDSETDPVRTKPTQELQAPAPFFSQRDPRWAQSQLGNSPSQTIASWGCMMTCNAMILAARGFDTNPGDLNNLLRSEGLYYNGYITQWNTASLVFPEEITYDMHLEVNQVSAETVKKIDSYLERGLPIMVNVDLNPVNAYNSNIEQHWVLIVSRDEDDYLILDPASMNENTISLMDKYGYYGEPLWKSIQQVVFYS